jgi:cytochrome b involved in lipid metabolism
MSNAWISVGIVVAAAAAVLGFILMAQNNTSKSSASGAGAEIGTTTNEPAVLVSTTSGESVTGTQNSQSEPGEKTYAMTEVVAHKDSSSCWSVIDGNVYDLTQWISKHPGGRQAIIQLCGKDGTEKFHGQHADNKRQADALVMMKIGVLAN